jgi:hypothetical protein
VSDFVGCIFAVDDGERCSDGGAICDQDVGGCGGTES